MALSPRGCYLAATRCGSVVMWKAKVCSSVPSQWETDAKSSQAISKLMSSVGIGCPPNLMSKMAVQSKGRTAYSSQPQMKGVCFGMKLPHQSLLNPMPHGVQGDLQKVLEPLLSYEIYIALVGPRIRQQPKKSGPSTSTQDLIRPLHSESEAIS